MEEGEERFVFALVMATWDIRSKNDHFLLPNHAFPLAPNSMERQGGRAPLALSERKSSSWEKHCRFLAAWTQGSSAHPEQEIFLELLDS
jgi:hypothetical protein